MSAIFSFVLYALNDYQRFDNVMSFVSEDASGSFGVQARHDRFMTVLMPGLARFRPNNSDWQYVATTGALLHFTQHELRLFSTGFWLSSDYQSLIPLLQKQLQSAQEERKMLTRSLFQMEHQMLKKLWEFEKDNRAS